MCARLLQAPAPAYNGYTQYDPAAYAAYYQQYNACYGAYGTAPPQPPPQHYPGYSAAQQPQGYPGYAQPAGYAAVQLAAAPPAAPSPLPAPPPQQQQQQQAVSSNAAPWQKAAAKVATVMQAQNRGPPAQPATVGVAKSFSIQPQPGRLRMGGGAAFAAASSPAYVKVCISVHNIFSAVPPECIHISDCSPLGR